MQTGGFGYPMYSTGNAHNTWFACTLVDADGKEIPWIDKNGKILKTVDERYHCAPGQRAFVYDATLSRTFLKESQKASSNCLVCRSAGHAGT